MTEARRFFLPADGLILRDPIEADIPDYVRWASEETAWMSWDAPWQDHLGPEQEVRRMRRILAERPPARRNRLEICLADGVHVGCLNSYPDDEHGGILHIGIDLRESRCWGQGIGARALRAWLGYLFDVHELDRIYCVTWSGNARMVRLAVRLGFVECERRYDVRLVGGKRYDAVRFALHRRDFEPPRDEEVPSRSG